MECGGQQPKEPLGGFRLGQGLAVMGQMDGVVACVNLDNVMQQEHGYDAGYIGALGGRGRKDEGPKGDMPGMFGTVFIT
jgi:hypothetical protein